MVVADGTTPLHGHAASWRHGWGSGAGGCRRRRFETSTPGAAAPPLHRTRRPRAGRGRKSSRDWPGDHHGVPEKAPARRPASDNGISPSTRRWLRARSTPHKQAEDWSSSGPRTTGGVEKQQRIKPHRARPQSNSTKPRIDRRRTPLRTCPARNPQPGSRPRRRPRSSPAEARRERRGEALFNAEAEAKDRRRGGVFRDLPVGHRSAPSKPGRPAAFLPTVWRGCVPPVPGEPATPGARGRCWGAGRSPAPARPGSSGSCPINKQLQQGRRGGRQRPGRCTGPGAE